jgi:hypothetical protein
MIQEFCSERFNFLRNHHVFDPVSSLPFQDLLNYETSNGKIRKLTRHGNEFRYSIEASHDKLSAHPFKITAAHQLFPIMTRFCKGP